MNWDKISSPEGKPNETLKITSKRRLKSGQKVKKEFFKVKHMRSG